MEKKWGGYSLSGGCLQTAGDLWEDGPDGTLYWKRYTHYFTGI
jgi:hypothetical protein